ncbi:MAG: ATP-binding cassette domain-containing protein [Oscillospiraceae bacterium]|nr:ATP-binding cassette domain-containing protein [Oscillospiraceae bacterium]
MLEVKNLTKQYGYKRAVDDISFTVNRGEILGFLGPNGAGKSTTMNMITGYLSSTSGSVTIDGHDILDDPIAAKSKIGYLPELPPLYMDMTVQEYLDFMFDLKKVSLPKKQHIAEICALARITDVYTRMIRNLSKGYRQRVGVAQALLGNPDLLILDEPTVGLDPSQVVEIRNLIKELGKKHTVILSSHILSEVQATCERVIIIDHGHIVADNTPDGLARDMSTDHSVTVRLEGPVAEVHPALKALPDLVTCNVVGLREPPLVYEYTLEARPGVDIRRAVFAFAASHNWPLLTMRSAELTLEEIFLKITSGSYAAPAPVSQEEKAKIEAAVDSAVQEAASGDGSDLGKENDNKGGEE